MTNIFPTDEELMNGPNALQGYSVNDFNELDEAAAEQADAAAVPADALAGFEAELTPDTNAGAGLVAPDYPDDFRAGFISIVGRPNVGKSTLTNALVGQKIAITSDRPETTRRVIRGVVHREHGQMVLIDTPGIHRPRTLLGKRLNEMVREALSEIDLALFCLPADQRIGPGDEYIARELKSLKTPVIAVVTKTDLVSKERLMKQLLAVSRLGDWAEVVPVSALAGDQVDLLSDLMMQRMPISPPLYPDGDLTDEPEMIMIAEFVREAALELVEDELPHSVAVQVEEIIEREPYNDAQREGKERTMADVHVNVFVERDSQKAILIGKKGSRIREIGTRARPAIEKLLQRRIFLDLHVRTAKDWQRNPKLLGRLGF